MDHQEDSCSFWAQLPLTMHRAFYIQEIMTGLCFGDFNISKINRSEVGRKGGEECSTLLP